LQFIDGLGDLAALVFDQKTKSYLPFSKDWIKEQIIKRLTAQA
jgi:hypothetical protein